MVKQRDSQQLFSLAGSEKAYDTTAYQEELEADRLVIRQANLSIVSEDVQNSVEAITDYAEKVKGFVVNVELWDLEDSPRAEIVVRVPADILMDAITFIREQGIRVVNQTVSGEDVTEEFVDNEARLKNLEASEEQFAAIMKRAGKIEEVLAVQRELESVRGRIESLKARQKYLTQSADMSKITVNIATDEKKLPVVEEDQWMPVVVIKDAVRALIGIFQSLADLAIWIVVFVPVWGTAYLVYRRIKKKA